LKVSLSSTICFILNIFSVFDNFNFFLSLLISWMILRYLRGRLKRAYSLISISAIGRKQQEEEKADAKFLPNSHQGKGFFILLDSNSSFN
jgi:hypothetical protein